MELQLVSKQTAILAKELGFEHGPTIEHFGWNHKKHLVEGVNWKFKDLDEIMSLSEVSAPTQELLAKWLRDTHQISVEVLFNGSESFYYWIKEIKPFGKEWDSTTEEIYGWKNYESALEAGLLKTLNILKDKK